MLNNDTPQFYTIRVQGHLDPLWSKWFDGMSLVHVDGSTLLSGQVADQAALYGLLARLNDLGLTLIAVERAEP